MNMSHKSRVDRVVDYIQANLGEELSLMRLSDVACYSEFHFSRIFKAEMGESVHQFVRRLRLEKAAELLLANTGTPITEIALMCGFATPSSFAKGFRSHFAMSASRWRQQRAEELADGGGGDVGRVAIVDGGPVWTFGSGEEPPVPGDLQGGVRR